MRSRRPKGCRSVPDRPIAMAMATAEVPAGAKQRRKRRPNSMGRLSFALEQYALTLAHWAYARSVAVV
jgi:hypothetical protein